MEKKSYEVCLEDIVCRCVRERKIFDFLNKKQALGLNKR